MRLLHSARWFLLALLLSLVPASSYAGIFISVGFAPPVLPVYDQPPCPQEGLMWTPGYWAYGPDGYYWVPGAWVPAPYQGALWTPGYWGWSGGLFAWHEGYWGLHIGYYGGVNYGFGYGGIGFAGGEWRGGAFAYNTSVMRVDTRFVHVTFVDPVRVQRGFVARDSRVAFSGGPGGINHPPSAQERIAEHEPHMERTSFQTQHANAAMSDHSAYFNANHGRPSTLAASRPLGSGANNASTVNRGKSAQDSWDSRTAVSGGNGSGGRNAGVASYNASHSNTGNTAAGPGGNGNGNTGMAAKGEGASTNLGVRGPHGSSAAGSGGIGNGNTGMAVKGEGASTNTGGHNQHGNSMGGPGGHGNPHPQPGMAVKGQGVPENPPHRKPH
jgi:hypothetical protein